MILIFLDTESTGLDPQKHRAIEIAFTMIDFATFKVIDSYDTLIYQPREVWAEADKESLKIHNISYEEILKGKSEKVLESEITTYFKNAQVAEKSGVFICQNPSMDRAFFNQIVPVTLQERCHFPYHWLDLASMYFALRALSNREHASQLNEKDLSKNKIAEYFALPEEKMPHRAKNGVNHLILCFERLFQYAKDGVGL